MSEIETKSEPGNKSSKIDLRFLNEIPVTHKSANKKEGKQCRIIGSLLFFLYGKIQRGKIRSFIRNLVLKLEGGEMFSLTIRRIFSVYHKIDIGLYTHGGCFVLHSFKPMTKIGRYCSIAKTACAFNANHPMNLVSSNALFFNPVYGYSKKHILIRTKLYIGNDVWLGHNSIIVPSVEKVGDGAVIGAGSMAYKDVPPYGVVTGVPGRVVRYRFSSETIEELLSSKWWEKSLAELAVNFEEFQKPLEGDTIR